MVYSAVPCSEMHNGISETYDFENGFSASVTLHCAWSDRFALMADIVGNRKLYPNGFTGSPTDGPRAYSATCKPKPGAYTPAGQTMNYTLAEITFDYSTKIEDLISESLEPTAEFIIEDHKRFRWSDENGDPLTEGEAPGKLQKGMNVVRTQYQLASLPGIILTGYGGCNIATYTSTRLGLSFGAETLLFNPPTTQRSFRTNGTKGWNLTTKFTYKPQGWNKFWRQKSQMWEEIVLAETGEVYKPYPPTDLTAILF